MTISFLSGTKLQSSLCMGLSLSRAVKGTGGTGKVMGRFPGQMVEGTCLENVFFREPLYFKVYLRNKAHERRATISKIH